VEVYHRLKDKYNILVTLHPNVALAPYKKELDPLGIPIDTELRAYDLVKNSDIIVHAGSTVAIGAHILGKPCFQYLDTNRVENNWWSSPESVMSKISPYSKTVSELIENIEKCELGKSNANLEAIKDLETGRCGLMDGHAIDRAVGYINQVDGSYRPLWPRAKRDYDHPLMMKDIDKAFIKSYCGTCKKFSYVANPQWLAQLSMYTGKQITLPEAMFCPNCAAQFYVINRNQQ